MDISTGNIKLSNVIGAPFSDYVLLQLYERAARGGTKNRTNEEVLYLANKTAWVRLTSSVNVTLPASQIQDYYKKLGVPVVDSTEDALAKNYILEAGTSIQTGDSDGITLRKGFGSDGAYGLGGPEELGYRPMPGLTAVNIETTGRLGSLRLATISFKVWNMHQLNVVEALYFRLGYSMILEWGHTQYYNNDTTFARNEIYGIPNPFTIADVEGGKRKEYIQQQIAKKARSSSGNYDGMMGVVSHFNWAMNQEGGYDCTVKLVGLGSIIDSVRINQAYKIPGKLIKAFKSNEKLLEEALNAAVREAKAARALAEQLKKEQDAAKAEAANNKVGSTPTNPEELWNKFKTYGNFSGTTLDSFINATSVTVYDNATSLTSGWQAGGGGVAYSTPFGNYAGTAEINKQAEERFGGLWYNSATVLKWQRLPKSGASVTLNPSFLNTFTQNVPVVVTDTSNETSNVPSVTLSFTNLTGANYITKQVDGATSRYSSQYLGGANSATVKFSNNAVALDSQLITKPSIDSPIQTGTATIAINKQLSDNRGQNKNVYIRIKLDVDKSVGSNKWYQPTRAQILAELDKWASNPSLTDVTVSAVSTGEVQIEGFYFLIVPTEFRSSEPGAEQQREAITKAEGATHQTPVRLTFITNNPGFISSISLTDSNGAQSKNNVVDGNTGDIGGNNSKVSQDQIDSSLGYASALHAMLIVVESRAQVKALNKPGVIEVDITPETIEFYNDGVLKGLLTDTNNIPDKAEPFNLLAYAKKGFNSDLMLDPSKYSITPDVDFKQLCKAYVVKYPNGVQFSPRSPVYIPLGYLLAFLNNMCLVYDSIDATLVPSANANSNSNALKDNSSHPYFYVDFNPETNFCLTSPQQLSVDPYVCLIPFNADDAQYTSIFPKDTQLQDKFNPGIDTAGKAKGSNVLTAALQTMGVEFKPKQTSTQANRDYQGKVMNILINVQYLIELVREYQGSDKEHAVRFQPFLERIMVDVNKSMGNINSFRIAYRDDSNVVQIQDDQWVPSLVAKNGGTEISMLQATSYNSKLKAGGDTRKLAGLLPLFSPDQPGQLEVGGSLGIAREFKINTVFSTRLASTIAISAQADTGSVNATDHSSLSWMNINKQDRYKKYIKDASSDLTAAQDQAKTNKVDTTSANLKAAQMLNDHITSVYSNFTTLNRERVESAKNYYIERMSKVKSGDILTTSAPFIPVELNLTIDGVSGIIMGNAFTVPEERLPLSLRGEDGLSKIAFIVTGLHHSIENNEWLTRIKGQVIKLRQQTVIPKASTTIATIQYRVGANNSSGNVESGGTDYQLSSYGGPIGEGKQRVCPGQYPGAGAKYSCARQVKTVVTQDVFNKKYGYTFVKNKSDINLKKAGLAALTEGEIDKDTILQNHFDQGTIPSPVANLVIHHTDGGTVQSNVDTFKERGFPAHYLIGKNGDIHQFLPNGALAWHTGTAYNSYSIGIEVVAKDDKDVNKKQIEATVRLAEYLGFSRSQIVGHGEINKNKQEDEGRTITNYIRTLI